MVLSERELIRLLVEVAQGDGGGVLSLAAGTKLLFVDVTPVVVCAECWAAQHGRVATVYFKVWLVM